MPVREPLLMLASEDPIDDDFRHSETNLEIRREVELIKRLGEFGLSLTKLTESLLGRRHPPTIEREAQRAERLQQLVQR